MSSLSIFINAPITCSADGKPFSYIWSDQQETTWLVPYDDESIIYNNTWKQLDKTVTTS